MTINRFFGAVLLIAGTAIGAGMLALPVVTGSYGYIPALLVFATSWLVMTYAALLMLEVNLWLPAGSNIISMSKATLGKSGQIIAWLAYLLLLYALMSAYLSGMHAMLHNYAANLLHIKLNTLQGVLFLIVIFSVIIYCGAKPTDYFNRLLIIGLIITFVILIFIVSPHIKPKQLAVAHPHMVWMTLPLIITAFGFHIVIPSLRSYLQSDIRKLRFAIISGSCLPLLAYLIWETVILGTIPVISLQKILASGQPAVGLTVALNHALQSSLLATISQCFAFFAIATSFIGVSLSLFDFLADGFKVEKTKLGKIAIAIATFIPPLIFVLYYPAGFILALNYAGVFVAILLIILPAAMVFSGRYVKKLANGYRVFGGIIPLLLITIFAIAVIVIEVL